MRLYAINDGSVAYDGLDVALNYAHHGDCVYPIDAIIEDGEMDPDGIYILVERIAVHENT